MELEKLKNIISTVMNIAPEDITEDTSFIKDLSCDSIEIFQIIMGIEEEFGFEIPTDEITSIKTVSDAIKKIRELQNE